MEPTAQVATNLQSGLEKPVASNEKPSDRKEERVISLPNGKLPIALSRLQAIYLRNLSELCEEAPRTFPVVDKLPPGTQKKILVTGGAGFVGSHLVDRLMLMGHQVIALDNFHTGTKKNVAHWLGHPNFDLIRHDVVDPMNIECDLIYHLACPASPPHYQADSAKTIEICVIGTRNVLELARKKKARMLYTSTSEVYGDPLVHPQPEDYWGNVNPIGIRACYDEGKRCAEALIYCYLRQHNVEVRVSRIFNTYGPRMGEFDGRVVTNFVTQALRGEPITVYGDGLQTRSFQYVHDLVSGLIALMNSDHTEPTNIGNPEEYPILEFAKIIKEITGSASPIVHSEKPADDPQQRRPNIEKAKKVLGWQPEYKLRDGLSEMLEYFRVQLGKK